MNLQSKRNAIAATVCLALLAYGLTHRAKPSNELPYGSHVWHGATEYIIMTVGEAHGQKQYANPDGIE